MNYITQLQLDSKSHAQRVEELKESLRQIKACALSPKHQGVDADGERKDWIASGDVVRWVDEALRA